jgi:hypothetical protein
LAPNYASNKLVTTITTNDIVESTTRIREQIQPVTTDTSPIPTRRQICEKFTLNAEQAQAFYIICRHVDGESHLKTGKNKSSSFHFSINYFFFR